MMDFVYEGCDPDGSLADEVKANKAFPLVRELRFKYGLMVTGKTNTRYISNVSGNVAFTMAHQDGINVCKVYTENDGNELTYCYHSPHYEKDRGSDTYDRHTLRSKKLSSLMGTLKKNNAVVATALNAYNNTRAFEFAMNTLANTQGDYYHTNRVDKFDEQLVLDALFEGKTIDSLPEELINNLKKAHDGHNRARDVERRQVAKVNEMFNKCYIVYADTIGNEVVTGIMSMPYKPNTKVEMHIIEPLKRMSLEKLKERYPELGACMTMQKVHNQENRNVEMVKDIPAFSQHIPELDVITSVYSRVDDFNGVWMFTPCNSTSTTSTQ